MTHSNVRHEWWRDVFFGLHYDLHANEKDVALGAELTHEHLREQLAKVRPDFVQCDCKGHPGYASYPTKVGTPAPGIARDALRIHRDVTRELGIPLSVHYSGIRDARAKALHPEWAAVDAAGQIVNPPYIIDMGILCPRSDYVDALMIPQMLEIIEEYDVDGFWVDGDNWAARDCYCPRCREAFARLHGGRAAPVDRDDPDWPLWRAFQRDSFTEYVRKYTEAVHVRKPDCAVCSNWMYSMRHPGPVTVPVDYLSGDFMSSFGCERAEMEGRYLDGHGMPWNLMAWTFCRSDNALPHQMKTVEHLRQEAAEVMSCGGAVFLYNQPQRSGWLTSWHQDIFAEVAGFCRERRAFSQATTSVPDAVVLLGDDHIWKHNTEPFCMGEGYYCAEGAMHALIENQHHVDLLDNTRLCERISGYALVVVGEQDPVSREVLAALEAYAGAGGKVLMTGAHLADACSELVGVAPAGPVNDKPWFIPHAGECVELAGPWRPVRVTSATAVAPVMTERQPGKDETAFPAITRRRVGSGEVIAVHGNVMRTYYLGHHPRLRNLLGALLESLNPSRPLRVSGPPSLEVTLRQGRGFRALHLVNRAVSPTLTPRLHIVEQVPATGRVEVQVRMASQPAQVTLEPGGRPVAWQYRDGWVHAAVEHVAIHDILVLHETAGSAAADSTSA